jgi:hypothetical protein
MAVFLSGYGKNIEDLPPIDILIPWEVSQNHLLFKPPKDIK